MSKKKGKWKYLHVYNGAMSSDVEHGVFQNTVTRKIAYFPLRPKYQPNLAPTTKMSRELLAHLTGE